VFTVLISFTASAAPSPYRVLSLQSFEKTIQIPDEPLQTIFRSNLHIFLSAFREDGEELETTCVVDYVANLGRSAPHHFPSSLTCDRSDRYERYLFRCDLEEFSVIVSSASWLITIIAVSLFLSNLMQ